MIGDLDPLALSERVADRYLDLGAQHAPSSAPPPADLASYSGTFWNSETYEYLRFTSTAGTLALDAGDTPQKLLHLGHGSFQAQNSTTRYAFHAEPGRVTVEVIDDDSDPILLQKMPPVAALPGSNLSDYVGTYYSDELGVSWTIEARNGGLFAHQWMFPAQDLKPILPDIFSGDLSEGSYALRFSRDAAGHVNGFAVGTTMVRPLHFSRCEPASPHDRGPLSFGCKLRLPGPRLMGIAEFIIMT